MKLTLRKANALQLLINEQINTTALNTSVTVIRYDDPVKLVLSAVEKFEEAFLKKLALLAVLYSVRQKVSDASQKAGVPAILSEVARIDKVTGVLKPLAELAVFAPEEEALKEAFSDLKKDAPVNAYSRKDSFTTGIIPQKWVPGYAKEVSDLRKQKQKLSDKLLELNIQNQIELSLTEEEVLKRYDLI